MAISEEVTHLREKLLRKLLTNSDQLGEIGIKSDHLELKNPTKKAETSNLGADSACGYWAILDSNQ